MSDYAALLGVKGGPAIRPGSNMPTATLVRMAGRHVLVDAGLGAAKGVCDQGVELRDLDAIVITHLHSDHYLELGPLLHTAWTAGLNAPMPVYGPTGLAEYWAGFLTSMAFDISLRIEDEGRVDLASLAELHQLSDGAEIDLGGLALRTLLNDHPPITESYALRFDGARRALCLSGDTAYMPAMAVFAAGADLLIHEAMLTDGVEAIMERMKNGDDRLRTHILRSHTTAEDVGRMAR
ncbi:MAG: MBL fold metallo-hydrolase, partial [Pseudomonadota bacterium]